MKKAVCTSALAVLLMAGAIGSRCRLWPRSLMISYNYDFYGNVVESPDIYQPDQIISGSALGVGGFYFPIGYLCRWLHPVHIGCRPTAVS